MSFSGLQRLGINRRDGYLILAGAGAGLLVGALVTSAVNRHTAEQLRWQIVADRATKNSGWMEAQGNSDRLSGQLTEAQGKLMAAQADLAEARRQLDVESSRVNKALADNKALAERLDTLKSQVSRKADDRPEDVSRLEGLPGLGATLGHDEETRFACFAEWMAAGKANIEKADARYNPATEFDENSRYLIKLNEASFDEIRRKYGLTKEQMSAIGSEAAKKKWLQRLSKKKR